MYVLTEFAVRAVPLDENDTPANDAPVFLAGGDYTRTIDENSPAGTLLGAPVTANPVDGDVLYYTIETPGDRCCSVRDRQDHGSDNGCRNGPL